MSEGGVKYIVNRSFPSSPEMRKEALSLLLSAAMTSGRILSISEDELTLIVDEAVTNAMEHGNHWDRRKSVHVSVLIKSGYLHMVIEDEGTGFDFENQKSEFEEGNKLSSRGRGLSLIRRFCDPVWSKGGRSIDLPVRIG